MEFFAGLAVGAVAAAVITFLLKSHASPQAGSVSITPVCEGVGKVRVRCRLYGDPHYDPAGVWIMVYNDPATTPPDKPAGTLVEGPGPDYEKILDCASSGDADKVVVWPIFKVIGAKSSETFGPCTSIPTTPSPPTTTNPPTTTSTTTTKGPAPPGRSR